MSEIDRLIIEAQRNIRGEDLRSALINLIDVIGILRQKMEEGD